MSIAGIINALAHFLDLGRNDRIRNISGLVAVQFIYQSHDTRHAFDFGVFGIVTGKIGGTDYYYLSSNSLEYTAYITQNTYYNVFHSWARRELRGDYEHGSDWLREDHSFPLASVARIRSVAEQASGTLDYSNSQALKEILKQEGIISKLKFIIER